MNIINTATMQNDDRVTVSGATDDPGRSKREWQARQRERRSGYVPTARERKQAELERVRALVASDRQAAHRRALFGTFNAPEDYGTDGTAAALRERVIEDADGEHAGSASRKGSVQKRVRVACECHVQTLHARGVLNDDELATALRFRGMWMASRHSSRVTANYAFVTGGGASMNESDYRVYARRFIDTCKGVVTDREWVALVAVAGQDEHLQNRKVDFVSALQKLMREWKR